MALPSSGQVSMKDIVDEKKGNTTAVQNVSLKGLSQDGVDSPVIPNFDYETTGGVGVDVDNNVSSGSNPPNQSPPFQMSEFFDYDHDFDPTSFNGTGAGSVSSFTTNTSTSVNVASSYNVFNLDTSSFRSASFWEMNNNHTQGNSPITEANSTAAIRIGNDKTNNRIMILLMKDGDSDAQAGAGSNSGYILIPYINLANATWTYTYEYDTSSNGYSTANSDIGVFKGAPGMEGTYTTSGDDRTIPSNTNGTYESIPSFTGMATTGESLYLDGTSHRATWTAKVSRFVNNTKVSVGRTAFHGGSINVRVRIKAVDGSNTYTALSNYWTLGLSAQRGVGL